jgi:inorganic pyrophosphatase
MKEFMIGKVVKVIVDRPIGTHHPNHKDLIYSVNYGYVPEIFAPDGEEQDAYILGVNEPVTEFLGKVIAIIHRLNDIEDKWVVAPEGRFFTKEEIANSVAFQEKFFDIEIMM